MQGVDSRKTPTLNGRPSPVKQPGVRRELEAYVRFTQGVPARSWKFGEVPDIRISERKI